MTAADPFMSGDSDDTSSVHGNDHLSVTRRSVGVRPPDQQSPNDLRHLVEPRGGTSDIERLELLGVAFLSVTNDHASGDSIAAIGPFGVHAFPVGFGPERSRPPLARLRLGSTPGAANADESRWMVDQRASSRPFSIREMSAWETPACSASSACVHPSSIRRSRIESPGRVSPAMVARSVMDPVYVSFHIAARGAGTSARQRNPAARLLSRLLSKWLLRGRAVP